VAVAQRLGVDRIVEYKDEDLATVLADEFPDGIDVAYDGVGGPLLGAICSHLKPHGMVLVVGSISQYPHNEHKPPHGIDGIGDIMDEARCIAPPHSHPTILDRPTRTPQHSRPTPFAWAAAADHRLMLPSPNGQCRSHARLHHTACGWLGRALAGAVRASAHGCCASGGTVCPQVFRPGKTVDLPSGNGRLVGNVWGDSFTAGVLPEWRDRLYADHAAGRVVALVDTTKRFCGVSEAVDAVEHMLSGRSKGKVVLHVSEH
jgi:hypothetical protein